MAHTVVYISRIQCWQWWKHKHILPLSYERIHENNPHKNPRFIEDELMFFTHIEDHWQFRTTTTITTQTAQIKYKQEIELNERIEENNQAPRERQVEEKREKWHIHRGTQSPNSGTQKETERRGRIIVHCHVVPY